MTMRSLGSISSELCEMQALRDSNVVLNSKDLEWQRRIAGPRSIPGLLPPVAAPAAPQPQPQPQPHHYSRRAESPTSAHHHRHQQYRQVPPASPPPLPHHPCDEQSPPASPLPSSLPTSSEHSASTHLGSPDLDAGERRKGDGCRHGRVGKIRRHRMTKEEEARFNVVDLADLKGSTAAKSRKMTVQERDIMLHKRRLRNRQSAARSRDKQRKTIGDVGDEVDELLIATDDLRERYQKKLEQLAKENDLLQKVNDGLKKENEALKKENEGLKKGNRQTGGCLKVSMSSDMLDRIIGGDTPMNNGAPGAMPNVGGMLKIPSHLHLSLSTDKLLGGDIQWAGGQLPPLPRNGSILERLLDFAAGSDAVQNDITMNNSLPDNSISQSVSETTAGF